MLRSAGFKTHLYRYGYHPWGNNKGYAPHAAEVGMVFGYEEYTCINSTECPEAIFPYDDALSNEMQEVWAAFAKDSDPGFPPYVPDYYIGTYLNISESGVLAIEHDGYEEAKCDLWDEMGEDPKGLATMNLFCSQSLGA